MSLNNNWWLSVDKETLQVCRVSPTLEEEESLYVLPIDRDLGISFVEGPHLINDYVVFHDGVKVHFVKKEKSNQVFVPFYYTPAILEEGVENPDILLSVNRDMKELTITLRNERRQYGLSLYVSLSKEKQRAQFYVSAKNDPNLLIETIEVDMIKLINTGKSVVPFKHDPSQTSIFTRKVFDSYGLEIL
jgi:hydrogenase maturation factor